MHGWTWAIISEPLTARHVKIRSSNKVAQTFTVYISYQLFAFYLRKRANIPLPATHWRLAILFYAASAVGNLFVVAPISLGGVFVDAAGKRWMISEIFWTSRLVSIFLMMPLPLIAWVKAARPAEPARSKVSLTIPSE